MAKQIQYDKFTAVDALSAAFGTVTDLAEELQNWYDSMPENMQQGDRASRIEEAAQALEGIDAVELSDAVARCPLDEVQVRTLGRRSSRSDRRDWALSLLQTVRDDLDAHVHGDEDEKRDQDLVDEVESVINDLDNAIGELENIDFPGAYG